MDTIDPINPTKINEEFLVAIRLKEDRKEYYLDKVPIIYFFTSEREQLKDLCLNRNISLEDIILFFKNTSKLVELNGFHKYCNELGKPFQGLRVNIQDKVIEIQRLEEIFKLNKKIIEDEIILKQIHKNLDIERFKETIKSRLIEYKCNQYGDEKDWQIFYEYSIYKETNDNTPVLEMFYQKIYDYKKTLLNEFTIWRKAFSINLAYEKCEKDKKNKSVLTYSHRILGWHDKIDPLSSKFNIELKTNFGYGRSSYFYTIIEYDGIRIVPLSDWVNYEFADISEIVRFTQKYKIINNSEANGEWHPALEYAKNACNISINDENQFIKQYIIAECERMVEGLEEILEKSEFKFTNRIDNKSYKLDKKGRVLISFRGEKVTGALDFLGKLLEYEKIIEAKSFIERIERCNSFLQPILANEIILIMEELEQANNQMRELKPQYESAKGENNDYNRKRNEIEVEFKLTDEYAKNKSNLYPKINEIFNQMYPKYKQFKEYFDQLIDSYNKLTQKIAHLQKEKEVIMAYNLKISNHFKKKPV